MFKGLKALLAGIVAGTVVGVLFAPKKGKELRKDFKKEIEKGGLGVNTFKNAAKEMKSDMGETGQKVYGEVSKSDAYKYAEKEVKKHVNTAKELVKEKVPPHARREIKKTFSKAKNFLVDFVARARKGVNKIVEKVEEKTGKHE
jgi:gas vesicle protein